MTIVYFFIKKVNSMIEFDCVIVSSFSVTYLPDQGNFDDAGMIGLTLNCNPTSVKESSKINLFSFFMEFSREYLYPNERIANSNECSRKRSLILDIYIFETCFILIARINLEKLNVSTLLSSSRGPRIV